MAPIGALDHNPNLWSLAGCSGGSFMRIIAIAAACLAMAACTTTQVKSAGSGMITAAEPNSKALLVQPDVSLALLTAAGLQERREDWSRSAQGNLASAIEAELRTRDHPIEALDPQASMEGRTGQLLRLHEAVGQSVLTFEYGPYRLPSKQGTFDWTLGEGAQEIRQARQADYALFVTARGTYSSAGRKALMIGAAMLGAAIPMGSQQVFASLVDLRTGRVVWFNVATAAPSSDIRSSEGAAELAKALMKGAPL